MEGSWGANLVGMPMFLLEARLISRFIQKKLVPFSKARMKPRKKLTKAKTYLIFLKLCLLVFLLTRSISLMFTKLI